MQIALPRWKRHVINNHAISYSFASDNHHKLLFLADSRGRGLDTELQELFDCDFALASYPGAGIMECIHRAKALLSTNKWSQVYCLSGLCDLISKDPLTKIVSTRDPNPVSGPESLISTIETALETVHSATCSSSKPKIIFAPITGMNLSVYNKRPNHVSDALSQEMLNQTISLINSKITQFNIHHGCATPWTSCIIHRSPRHSFTNHYHKLSPDGCHLTTAIRRHWAEALQVAFIKNT